jgi:hypothetical protein
MIEEDAVPAVPRRKGFERIEAYLLRDEGVES